MKKPLDSSALIEYYKSNYSMEICAEKYEALYQRFLQF
jgi:hypothetical protein